MFARSRTARLYSRQVIASSVLRNRLACSNFSSSSSPSKENSNGNTTISDYVFPWKPRPKGKFSLFGMFAETTKYIASIMALNGMNIKPGEYLEGADAAFRSLLLSIFQNPKLENRTLKAPEELLIQKKSGNPFNQQDVLPFEEMCNAQLSQAYNTMIDNFVQQYPNHKVCYELLKIKRISIYSGEVAMYVDRHRRRCDHLVVTNKNIVTTLAPPDWDPEEKLPNPDRMLIKFCIDFPCLEVFYVQDMETNVIVQGSQQPVTNRHQLELQAIIDIGEDGTKREFLQGWKIINLDKWIPDDEEEEGGGDSRKKWSQQRLTP